MPLFLELEYSLNACPGQSGGKQLPEPDLSQIEEGLAHHRCPIIKTNRSRKP